jgi:magnesium chelatase subunit D
VIDAAEAVAKGHGGDDAALACALLAVDPAGLGGAILRASPGPAREAWLAGLRALLPADAPVRRLPPRIEDERLLGGLDLPATLAAGRPVAQRGVLAEADGGVVLLPMAERADGALAARLAAVLDLGEVRAERDGLALRLRARIGLVALDEAIEGDEAPPAALAERLAFHIDLRDSPGIGSGTWTAAEIAAARGRLESVAAPDMALVEALCAAAIRIGVLSLRAPLLALKAARAHAALSGRSHVTGADAEVAARLVLAPRALIAPADEADDETPPPPPPEDQAEDETPPPPPPPPDEATQPAEIPTKLLIEAIRAALPQEVLDQAAVDRARRSAAARSRGAGAPAKSASRGRPAGVRAGALRSGARLNLVETLRAAAPWQAMRRAGVDAAGRIHVRSEDFRIQRFVQQRESVTIFAVDASGSTALQRLAEAKGAVELLLAKAYVSRASVALIAFRGQGAELILPPTRSLTRAKARLAGLPGGGGTPLASAMEAAMQLAVAERAKGRTPMLVFLTDGRANIGRNGLAGRPAAEADARAAAALIGEAGISSVFIDTSPRPAPDGDRFARAMGGVYAPLPYLDAQRLADAVARGQAAVR